MTPRPAPIAHSLPRLVLSTMLGAAMLCALPTIAHARPQPTVRVDDVTVTEGDGGGVNATFTVQLRHGQSPVTLDYATVEGTATADVDYEDTSGSLSLSRRHKTAKVVVPILGDTLDEPTETFQLRLSNVAGAGIADGTGIGSILDDDGGPFATVSDASAAEGSGSLIFPVELDGPSGVTVSFDYATTDGTALEGSDYTTTMGTLQIPAGQTTGQISVPLLDDPVYEAHETFGLQLSAPTDVSLADFSATGSIVDDDLAPTSLTLVAKARKGGIDAHGFLTYAVKGASVRVTLYKRVGSSWVKKGGHSATVSHIRDRNGDGIKEGRYGTRFAKTPHGRYRVKARYAGDARHAPATSVKRVRV